jgi:lipid A 4'-phosphatase
MPIADDAPPPGRSRQAWTWLAAAAIAITVLFLGSPETDLAASRLFYAGNAAFIGQHVAWVDALRDGFRGFFIGAIALCVSGLLLTWRARPQWLHLGRLQWIFLAACLAVGPGLVANLLLKEHWGRARPRQVMEFGGTKAFTPPLLPARQCPRNCSFVSGEAASTFVVPYALAVLISRWSVVLVIAGTAGGLAAGLVRMAQGGHFLSDVVFAGVFMALVVLLLRAAMLRERPHPAKCTEATKAARGRPP